LTCHLLKCANVSLLCGYDSQKMDINIEAKLVVKSWVFDESNFAWMQKRRKHICSPAFHWIAEMFEIESLDPTCYCNAYYLLSWWWKDECWDHPYPLGICGKSRHWSRCFGALVNLNFQTWLSYRDRMGCHPGTAADTLWSVRDAGTVQAGVCFQAHASRRDATARMATRRDEMIVCTALSVPAVRVQGKCTCLVSGSILPSKNW